MKVYSTLTLPRELVGARRRGPSYDAALAALGDQMKRLLLPVGRSDAAESPGAPSADGRWLLIVAVDDADLVAIDWERVPLTGSMPGDPEPVVLRSDVEAHQFWPFRGIRHVDLPVRVLVVGAAEQMARWNHEDAALHHALRGFDGQWEVDVLPGRVRREELRERIALLQPQVIHLAGSALRTLRSGTSNSLALEDFDLTGTRLVVAACPDRATHDEVGVLLRSVLNFDARQAVLAVVSLAAGDAPDNCHCVATRIFYAALAKGDGLTGAIRELRDRRGSGAVRATVNGCPDQVMLTAPEPVVDPVPRAKSRNSAVSQLMVDRVAERRHAMNLLKSGRRTGRFVVIGPASVDDAQVGRVGLTAVLCSLVQAWRQDRGCAIHVDLRKPLENTERSAADGDESPGTELIAKLAEQVREASRGRDWGIDEELDILAPRGGGSHGSLVPAVDRDTPKRYLDSLVATAYTMFVKLARVEQRLVLAIDHFPDMAGDRGSLSLLVAKLFEMVLLNTGIAIVTTAGNHGKPEWFASVSVPPGLVQVGPWPRRSAAPLIREVGARSGIDWHTRADWQDESMRLAREAKATFGFELLRDASATVLLVGKDI